MKAKTMKVLGVIFLIIGIAGFAGCVFFWLFHYWAMENGYRPYFGDSLMVACTISMFVGFFIYPAVPFLIISKVRKNREVSDESKPRNNAVIYSKSQPIETINGFKFCACCGKKLPECANFCSQCGRKLN